jgi:hypothetical protein
VTEKFRVTEADREYMRRLGAFMAEAKADELADHLARPVNERLARSLALSKRARHGDSSRDGEDLAAFYRRARELGLARP